jgi:hypothetical protein
MAEAAPGGDGGEAGLPHSTAYLVEGGVPLHGRLPISGAKNAVLKLMAAAVLCQEPCIIRNAPRIADVEYILEVLRDLGAEGRIDRVQAYTELLGDEECDVRRAAARRQKRYVDAASDSASYDAATRGEAVVEALCSEHARRASAQGAVPNDSEGGPSAAVRSLAAGADLLCLGTRNTDEQVQAIEDAIARGEFDNLPGAGRPIELDDCDPLLPPEARMAWRILRNADVRPQELIVREKGERRRAVLALQTFYLTVLAS